MKQQLPLQELRAAVEVSCCPALAAVPITFPKVHKRKAELPPTTTTTTQCLVSKTTVGGGREACVSRAGFTSDRKPSTQSSSPVKSCTVPFLSQINTERVSSTPLNHRFTLCVWCFFGGGVAHTSLFPRLLPDSELGPCGKCKKCICLRPFRSGKSNNKSASRRRAACCVLARLTQFIKRSRRRRQTRSNPD